MLLSPFCLTEQRTLHYPVERSSKASLDEKAAEVDLDKDKTLLDVVNILPVFDVSLEDEALITAKVVFDVGRFENLAVSDVLHQLSEAMKILQSINSSCFSINSNDCCGGGSDARNRCLALTLEALAGVNLSHWCQGPYWALEHGNLMLQPHGLKLVPVPMVQTFLDGCYVIFKAKHFRGLKILISQGIRMLINNDEKFHIGRREHALLFMDIELEAFKLLPTSHVSTSPSSLTGVADRLGGVEGMEDEQATAAADEVELQLSQTDGAAPVAMETEATESAEEAKRVVSRPRDEETPPNLFYKENNVQSFTVGDESLLYELFPLDCFRQLSYLKNFIDSSYIQKDNSKLEHFRAGNEKIVLKVFSPTRENAKRVPDVCKELEETNYVSIAKPIHLVVDDRHELIGYIRKHVEKHVPFSMLDAKHMDMANFIGQLTRIVEYSFRVGVVLLFTLADIVVAFPHDHVIWINCENSRRVNDNSEKDDSDVESTALAQMVIFLQKFKQHPQYKIFMTEDDQIRAEFLSFDAMHQKCMEESIKFENFCSTYNRFFDALAFHDDGDKVDAATELPKRTTQDAAPKNGSQEEDECSESEASETNPDVPGEESKRKVLSVRHRQFWPPADATNTFFDELRQQLQSSMQRLAMTHRRTPPPPKGIVFESKRKFADLKAAHVTWTDELIIVVCGGLIVFDKRQSDITIVDHVRLIYTGLGERLLRSHDGNLYQFIMEMGFFRVYRGIIEEDIISVLREYMKMVEGLFRTIPPHTKTQ